MRILLIEPDALLAETYRRAFARHGFEVQHVTGAQAAIDAADAATPDLVVLELQLPMHNGVAFLYEFRSYAEWRDVPVIVVTHLSERDFMPVRDQLRQEFGVRAVHYKPQTSISLLVRSINDVGWAQ